MNHGDTKIGHDHSGTTPGNEKSRFSGEAFAEKGGIVF